MRYVVIAFGALLVGFVLGIYAENWAARKWDEEHREYDVGQEEDE